SASACSACRRSRLERWSRGDLTCDGRTVTAPVANAVEQRMLTKAFVLVTAATLALFIYIGVMIPLLPRRVEEQLGGNEVDIGLNLAVFSLAAVLIRPPLGRFAERHGLGATICRAGVRRDVAP